MSDPRHPDPQIPGFEWIDDMREISGFGGTAPSWPGAATGDAYERDCRAMVSTGCAWWANHPDADPRFKHLPSVYGSIIEDNADAEALSTAMVAAANGGSTMAMHQAAVGHVMVWHQLGSWIAYQKHMRQS